jgi:hypothetical protein
MAIKIPNHRWLAAENNDFLQACRVDLGQAPGEAGMSHDDLGARIV